MARFVLPIKLLPMEPVLRFLARPTGLWECTAAVFCMLIVLWLLVPWGLIDFLVVWEFCVLPSSVKLFFEGTL